MAYSIQAQEANALSLLHNSCASLTNFITTICLRHVGISQPEPKLSKVNVVDVIFCCWDLFVQPGLQMIAVVI